MNAAFETVDLPGGRKLHLGFQMYKMALPVPAWALETGRTVELQDADGKGTGTFVPQYEVVSLQKALLLAPDKETRDRIATVSGWLIDRARSSCKELGVQPDHWYLEWVGKFEQELKQVTVSDSAPELS